MFRVQGSGQHLELVVHVAVVLVVEVVLWNVGAERHVQQRLLGIGFRNLRVWGCGFLG